MGKNIVFYFVFSFDHRIFISSYVDTAEFLVNNGADMFALSKYKETPVVYASKRGYKELAHQFADKINTRRTLQAMRERERLARETNNVNNNSNVTS